MKKTLLAAALMAGFAGIAQAETSVTLYGVVDAGVGYERIKSGGDTYKRFGVTEGTNRGQLGSRWGLKGTEDLGNGLRANFQLESGFDVNTGEQLHSTSIAKGDRLFGRQATLGLSGDSWGQVDIGRQTTVGSRFFVDVHGQGWAQTGSGQAFVGQDTNRIDNSIVYVTPNYSGFQFGAGYSFNTAGQQAYKVSGVKDSNKRAVTTGLRYANGPIAVALSYDMIRLENAANLGTYKDASTWALSGSYDFEVAAVSLAFGQDYNGDYGRDDRYYKNFDYNNYAVALAAPIGEGKLSGEYTLSQPRKDAKSAGEKKQHNFSLVYKHPLSKRTEVYALGGYAKNYLHADGDKRTVAGVGITHRF